MLKSFTHKMLAAKISVDGHGFQINAAGMNVVVLDQIDTADMNARRPRRAVNTGYYYTHTLNTHKIQTQTLKVIQDGILVFSRCV